jgi:beta-lactamase regulating signal transducer with metallopeptidase domain
VPLPQGWWTSDLLLMTAWLFWAAFSATRVARAAAALRRARQQCRQFPWDVERLLGHWNQVRTRGRRTRLALSNSVRTAAVFSCGPPVIAVAPGLVDNLRLEEVDQVVIHEWAHIQRRDDVAQALLLAARVVAGWHPAVWWLGHRLEIEREVACDETAVAVTGSAKAYARCLTKAATLPARHLLPPVAALGALSSPALSIRISRVLSQMHGPRLRWARSSTAAAIALLGALSFALGHVRIVAAGTVVSQDPPAAPVQVDPLTPAGPAIVPAVPAARPGTGSPEGVNAGPVSRTLPPAPSPSTAPPAPAAARAAGSAPRTEAAIDRPAETPPLINQAPSSIPSLTQSPDPPLSSHGLQLPMAPNPSATDAPVPPWTAAATAGTAVGRGSQRAAVAAAGFFTRVSKRIAGSF